MIRTIDSWEPYEHFFRQFWGEKSEAQREQLLTGLTEAFSKKENLCFGTFNREGMTGLFVFDPLEELYFVMRCWLTRSEAAGREMLTFLKREYPGCGVEFTFRPENDLLRQLLTEVGATVFPVQQDMEWKGPTPDADTTGVVLLSKAYAPQYFALHRASDPAGETYWTGEMVAADPSGFCVFLALDAGVPVGYLDLGLDEEGNNVADLFIEAANRRKGWGRKLLGKAIEQTGTKPLTLQVDLDNDAAIRLYESMGFRPIQGSRRVDAIWRISK